MNHYTLAAHQQGIAHQLECAGFDGQTIADTLESEGDDLKEKRLA